MVLKWDLYSCVSDTASTSGFEVSLFVKGIIDFKPSWFRCSQHCCLPKWYFTFFFFSLSLYSFARSDTGWILYSTSERFTMQYNLDLMWPPSVAEQVHVHMVWQEQGSYLRGRSAFTGCLICSHRDLAPCTVYLTSLVVTFDCFFFVLVLLASEEAKHEDCGKTIFF